MPTPSVAPRIEDTSMSGSPPRVSSEEARAVWSLLFACALVLLPRLAVFPWSENLYGDAVVRTELAQRWLANPHWIAHMDDGAFQYGPLHVYLVAGALALGIDREDAGRWVSLLFGVLSVLPLWSLSRRLGGIQGAWWATAGFALWGMHIQMSTTAGSESVGLFFVLWSLALLAEGLEENRFPPLFGSALVLNLACAVRYDCWLLIPLICVLLLLGDRDRVAGVTRSVCYGLLALPFVAAWMQGNERAKGDPFAPLRYIESFHKGWVAEGVARWTSAGYRAQNLFFWPAVALFTLSPLIAWFGARGMVRVWRQRPEYRWLIWVALVPTAYFAFRSVVLLDFVPLARFAVTQVALLLPFVGVGYQATVEGKSPLAARAWAGAALGLAVLLPVGVGIATVNRDDQLATSLRPVSPVSTNPPAVMQVARWLKSEVAPLGRAAALDVDPQYWDLQIAFFSGLPDTRLARMRWDIFRKQVKEQRPEVLVRREGGEMEKEPDFLLQGDTISFDGDGWEEVPGFQRPWHVYRRAGTH
ncbi:MAG: ArnT family glycosyltransferase [Myxococcaceae bacterium]